MYIYYVYVYIYIYIHVYKTLLDVIPEGCDPPPAVVRHGLL